jgi:hypothetical protein
MEKQVTSSRSTLSGASPARRSIGIERVGGSGTPGALRSERAGCSPGDAEREVPRPKDGCRSLVARCRDGLPLRRDLQELRDEVLRE